VASANDSKKTDDKTTIPTTEVGAELASNSPGEAPKRWGWVSAKPSEYLIVFREGKVAERLCGQGGRFFKWPSDTYVLVPTTLKEVLFQANQVTRDGVDVRIRGMVVYRITDPNRIYKLINFANRPAAEAKLARMLSDMCRSTVKWLVANMNLEECNRKRKEEIAGALKREVAASTGDWGVELVTIDIQDVYVQDAALFLSMQANFKAEKDREASLAKLEAENSLEKRRLAAQRELEKDRKELAMEKDRREAEVKLAMLELTRRQEEEQFKLDRFRAEQSSLAKLDAVRQEQHRAEVAATGAVERVRLEMEAQQLAHNEEIRLLRERYLAENVAGRASLERLFLTESLPTLAEALATSLKNARLNVYQTGTGQPGSGNSGGLVPLAIHQLLDLIQQRLSNVPAEDPGSSSTKKTDE
jgi:regulator of protease activity HflC (stomatin/prohibitin superfamily)